MIWTTLPPTSNKPRRFITEARDLTTQAGARFVLAYAPTKINVYKGLGDIVTPDGGDLVLESFGPSLERWSSEQGIEYLDLTRALLESARGGELVYFLDDEHWTPFGPHTGRRGNRGGPSGAAPQARRTRTHPAV